MRALLICGSISRISHTRALMGALSKALRSLNCNVDMWDLLRNPMPIADPEFHYKPEETPNDNVRAFVAAVHSADALALGTPLYHGSMSGVLKNALDQLSSDALRNKPVALLSHASEERRCTMPCDHLQSVVRTMYGYATQTQIGTTKSDYRREGDAMVLISAPVLQRVERQAQELIRLSECLGPTRPQGSAT